MHLLNLYADAVSIRRDFDVASYLALMSSLDSAITELNHDALTARVALEAYSQELSVLYPAYSGDFSLDDSLVTLCRHVSIVGEGSKLNPSVYLACSDVLRWHREISAHYSLRDMLLELGVERAGTPTDTDFLTSILSGSQLNLSWDLDLSKLTGVSNDNSIEQKLD